MNKYREPIVGAGAGQQARPKAERGRSQRGLLLFVLLAVGFLVAVPALLLWPRAQVYTLRSFEAAPVTRATIEETVAASGTLASEAQRPVTTTAAGTLETLDVSDGDSVSAGQVLARLRAPELEDARRKARDLLLTARDERDRAVQGARATAQDAARDLQAAQDKRPALQREVRLQAELLRAGGASRQDLQSAQDKLLEAGQGLARARDHLREAQAALTLATESGEGRVAAAHDDLARADAGLARTVLRAPLAGRVVSVKAHAGDTLASGAEIFSVASLKRLRLDAQLDESAAARVKVGQPVRVTLGDQDLKGEVARVAGEASQGSGENAAPTVAVTVALKAAPPDARLGSSAALEITVGRRENTLTLPRGPYLTTGGERLAYVLGGGEAERREVRFGAQSAERVEVLDGLSEGERVIVSSYEAFKDQSRIRASASGELGRGAAPEGTP